MGRLVKALLEIASAQTTARPVSHGGSKVGATYRKAIGELWRQRTFNGAEPDQHLVAFVKLPKSSHECLALLSVSSA